MIGIISLEKSVIDQRLENYDTERRAISEKLKKPIASDEKRGRLQFRQSVIQKKEIQLFAINAMA